MIPALVLTAGLATRLRPLSLVRAKSALPVAQDTLARRVIASLTAAGVTEVVFNLHHLPQTLTALLGDGSDLGVRVRYSWESPRVLGSAGGPRRALPLLDNSTFLIVNGDTLTTLDIPSLVHDHRRTGALVTMALVPNLEPMKYGGVLLNPGGSIRGFVKPGAKEPSFHFIGVQVAEAAAFASVPDDVPYESTLTLYPALIRERPGSVRGFVTSAEFLDIGTPADYLATSLTLAAREHRGPLQGAGCTVAPDARLERTILWDRVRVGSGTLLRECVVTDDVHVPPDTSWHGIAMRVPNGDLAPGERRIGDIVVAAI